MLVRNGWQSWAPAWSNLIRVVCERTCFSTSCLFKLLQYWWLLVRFYFGCNGYGILAMSRLSLVNVCEGWGCVGRGVAWVPVYDRAHLCVCVQCASPCYRISHTFYCASQDKFPGWKYVTGTIKFTFKSIRNNHHMGHLNMYSKRRVVCSMPYVPLITRIHRMT